eukprot:2844838-Rhodomonas_salina.1
MPTCAPVRPTAPSSGREFRRSRHTSDQNEARAGRSLYREDGKRPAANVRVSCAAETCSKKGRVKKVAAARQASAKQIAKAEAARLCAFLEQQCRPTNFEQGPAATEQLVVAGVSFGQDNQMLPGEVVSRSESVGEATEQLQKAAPDQVEQIEVPAAVQAVQVLQRVYRGHLGRNEARDVLFDLMEAAEAEELEQRYYEDDEIMPMKDEVEPAPAAAVGSGDPRMHRRRSSQAMLVASQRAVDEVLASPLAIAESDAQRRQQEQQRKHSGLSSPFSSSPFASSPMTSSPIASSPLEKCRQVRRQSSRLELLAVQNAVSDALASPIAASLNAKSDLEQCAALCEEARRAMAAGDFEHALDLYEDAAAIETVAQHHLKRMLGVMHVAFTPDVSDEQQGRSIELGQKAQRALDDGMNRSAIIMFSKAIQLDPLEVDAFVGRATAHLREGSFSDAAIDASVALVLDPDDARAAQIEAE